MGKKTKGRKRHIVVDVLGCMLSVDVHAANIHDTKSGISTAKEAYMSYKTIQKFCADAGYRGTFVSNSKEKLGLGVDISEKIKPHNGKNFPGVGLLNVLFLGLIIPEDSPKIMNFPFLLRNLWLLFLIYILC